MDVSIGFLDICVDEKFETVDKTPFLRVLHGEVAYEKIGYLHLARRYPKRVHALKGLHILAQGVALGWYISPLRGFSDGL